MHVTLQATDRTLTLDLSETVRLLDARTIEVDCPHFLEGGRMPVELDYPETCRPAILPRRPEYLPQ